MSDFIKLYFPKWLFPNNLGDSLNVTFVPKILKAIYPNKKLEVITYGFLIDVFKIDPNVDVVRLPHQHELYLDYTSYAFNKDQDENIKVIYPDWHPKVFSFWKKNHEILHNHPTANLITINFSRMNWSEFKSKYKNEIRVGVIVFIAMMLIRLVKSILNK